MGRIRPEDIDKYQSSNSEFFSLKNDKDTAVVYFMAEDLEDLDIYVIHKVKDGEKTRNVSCLRNAGEPIDYCPLCAAGYKPEVRIFIKMYDPVEDKVKVWDRGRSFLKVLEPLARRFKPLFSKPFEIERNGVAGDMKTTYSIFPIEPDENYPLMDAEDFPEPTEIKAREKSIVLDRTYEELDAFLNGEISLTLEEEEQNTKKHKQQGRDSFRQPAKQPQKETIKPRGNRVY